MLQVAKQGEPNDKSVTLNQRVGGSIPSRRTLTRYFVESSPRKHHSRSTYASFTFGALCDVRWRYCALLRVSVISRGN